MEQITIVDKEDTAIGAKKRSELELSDIVRTSALWITDKQGNILLAQRSFKKDTNPGKWGPAVAGTVELGESYIENVTKETAEEIGVKLKTFKPLKKMFDDGPYGPYFVQWFIAVIDKNTALKPQKEEVEELGWFSKDDIKMLLSEMPDMFIDSAPKMWPELFLQ